MSNTASLKANLYSNIGDYIDAAAFSAENALGAYETSHGPYNPYTTEGIRDLAVSYTVTKEFDGEVDIDDDGEEYETLPDLDIDDYMPFFCYFFSKFNKVSGHFQNLENEANQDAFLSCGCPHIPCLLLALDIISTVEERAEEIGYTNKESEIFFEEQLQSKEYQAARRNIKAFGVMLHEAVNLDLNGMRAVFYSITNSNYARRSTASLSSIYATMNGAFDGIGEWRK